MSQGRRKFDSINLVKLYAEGRQRWNHKLERALKYHDVEWIKQTIYGLQCGMDDLIKNKIEYSILIESLRKDKKLKNEDEQTPEVWFLRLQKSLENTAKQIFRTKYPNPCDKPLMAAEYSHFLEEKRKRDQEFEGFLRKVSF